MCIICEGGTQLDILSFIHDKFHSHGWAVQAVTGHSPRRSWVYSVGLAPTFEHPELVAKGADINLAAAVINELGEMIRAGQRLSVGDEIGTSHGRVTIGAVHPSHIVETDLVAMATRFYGAIGYVGRSFEVLQVRPTHGAPDAVALATVDLSRPRGSGRRRNTQPCTTPPRSRRRVRRH